MEPIDPIPSLDSLGPISPISVKVPANIAPVETHISAVSPFVDPSVVSEPITAPVPTAASIPTVAISGGGPSITSSMANNNFVE